MEAFTVEPSALAAHVAFVTTGIPLFIALAWRALSTFRQPRPAKVYVITSA